MVRFLVAVSAILLWLSVPEALAGEFQIKIVDPDAAPVAGAQVFIYRAEQSAPLQVRSTSGEGIATFNVEGPASVRVEVLAPTYSRRPRLRRP